MSDVAIHVADLVKVFHPRTSRNGVRAVDGLSFDVKAGTVFGLLGPNGAGKTTTLRILTTLVRPTSGRASVCGFDVMRQALDVRRNIVVVIQEQAAELFLSVRENLLTFARFHGQAGAGVRRRAETALHDLGLIPEANRKVQDLSGGFRRRVQVAKVFMVDTPVVFLDEFSTGMDPALKRSVMNLLRREVARGRTIVLTTHILSEAEELCDDLLIIDRGRQLARGDLNTLKLLSERVYDLTMTFDEVPPDLDATIASYRPLRSAVHHNTVQITLHEEESRVLALASQLAARRRVLRIELTGASLEDVFIDLTQKGGIS
ncbi:MAG TPA: ABC transporter ATP-binding protein [Vicinamibacterales bacterium]|nr:ABC transporter ATP-binding protein [Vicinamibacterales bacterium]